MNRVISYRNRFAKIESKLLVEVLKVVRDSKISDEDMELLIYHHLLPGLEYLVGRIEDIVIVREKGV